jgi:crotonobetainyl-CoA:carnitine CoA-transferase CaiB-like acyl-CoA transferase
MKSLKASASSTSPAYWRALGATKRWPTSALTSSKLSAPVPVMTRVAAPPFLQDNAGHETFEAAYYLGTNRNKRSVTCDMSQPARQALIRELAVHCDVFVENFKVGDMARYGLDYASLKALNPRLVYCSVTGFGQTGPYADRAGYDYAIQGMGGLMSIAGERDDLGGGPQKVAAGRSLQTLADLPLG